MICDERTVAEARRDLAATKRTDPVGCWTRGQIRDQAHEFLGHSLRSGRTTIGPVWNALGPTAREGLIDSQVLQALRQLSLAGFEAVKLDDIGAFRRAFVEECIAVGFTIHG